MRNIKHYKNLVVIFLLVSVLLLFVVWPIVNPTKNDPNNTLVLYTSQPLEHINQVVKSFNTIYPELKIDVYRSGTVEIIHKIKAENFAGKIKADLVLVSDQENMKILKTQNLLYCYKNHTIKNIPQQYIDPELYYFGTKLITLVLVYNSPTNKIPNTWSDLSKAKFKKQIIMANPNYSGLTVLALQLLQNKYGKEFTENLQNNSLLWALSNGAVLDAMLRGTQNFGVCADFLVRNAIKDGAQLKMKYFQDLSVVATEPVAILKASSNKANAKKFVEFLFSPLGQELTKDLGYTSIIKS